MQTQKSLGRFARRFLNAAGSGDLDTMASLVKAGLPIDAKAPHLSSALFKAAARGQATAIRWLVDHGAPVDGRDLVNRTALIVAAENGSVAAVDVLLDLGAAVDPTFVRHNPIVLAAMHGHTPVCKRLIEGGASIEAGAKAFTSPLIIAAAKRRLETVRFLLKRGADPNGHTGNGWTALFQCRDVQVIDALVRAGADVNYAMPYGTTPIMMAAARGDVDVVRYFIECRANVNARDQHGCTVLAFGRSSHTADITNMLVKAGAKD